MEEMPVKRDEPSISCEAIQLWVLFEHSKAVNSIAKMQHNEKSN
jgi:hypothetical protein